MKIYHTLSSQIDFVDSALRTFFQIHVGQPPGDVLIFLPGERNTSLLCRCCSNFRQGQEEIEGLEKSIATYANQLPVGHLNVSSRLLLSIRVQLSDKSNYTGSYLPDVCLTSRWPAGESTAASSGGNAEVYSRNEHRGDLYNHTWCPLCD